MAGERSESVGDESRGANAPEALAEQYHAFRNTAALVELTGRGVVRIDGPDATSFLQNLVSADLEPVGEGHGVHSLLLSPQGKLDVDFRLLRLGANQWLALTDTADAPRLVASLTRFKIRVDVEMIDASESWARIEARGPGASEAVSSVLGRAELSGPSSHALVGDLRVVAADWPGAPAVEVLGTPTGVSQARDLLVASGVVAAGEAAREAIRIESGVPRGSLDLDESVIPQEAFLDSSAVSFTKGCFLGQELVCRIDTRGRVNRFLRGLVADSVLHPELELVLDGKTVGSVTSAAVSPDLGPVGLAFVRREVEPPASVTVRGDHEEVAVRVVELPITGPPPR